jgi:hypothetical protein
VNKESHPKKISVVRSHAFRIKKNLPGLLSLCRYIVGERSPKTQIAPSSGRAEFDCVHKANVGHSLKFFLPSCASALETFSWKRLLVSSDLLLSCTCPCWIRVPIPVQNLCRWVRQLCYQHHHTFFLTKSCIRIR